MLVTYKDLKEGYILKDGDTLNIYGCKSVVCASSEGCYLRDTRGLYYNDWLFQRIYGMSDAQKDAWAAEYGGKPGCFFPAMPTLQQLTDFVKKIYETCPFKVGDTIRIKRRQYSVCDYPFAFIDQMAKQAGKTFRIEKIELITCCNPFEYKDAGGGDIHCYRLDGISYTWTSNMFELVKRADEVQSRKESDLKRLAEALQGTSAHIGVPIPKPRFLFSGALGERETTPVSELKKDKIPEGEDITVRPPKHYSTTFKI